ncbi:hypothetical protein D3C73_759060 [compost metagenome]
MRGASSSMLNPHTGQAKLELNSSSSWPMMSTRICPPESFSAVSRESVSRVCTSSLITIRSTTTSMVCFLFFSSTISSVTSRSSPSTRTRTKPCFEISLNSPLCSPLRPEITGARICSRVFSGYCMIRSTICSTVWEVISMPWSGQCGCPIRANSSRR